MNNRFSADLGGASMGKVGQEIIPVEVTATELIINGINVPLKSKSAQNSAEPFIGLEGSACIIEVVTFSCGPYPGYYAGMVVRTEKGLLELGFSTKAEYRRVSKVCGHEAIF